MGRRMTSGIGDANLLLFVVVALPPSVELNTSSAFALHLCLVKKSPSSRQFSGFIVNYVIYFCPVSSEDDLGCAGTWTVLSVFMFISMCLK